MKVIQRMFERRIIEKVKIGAIFFFLSVLTAIFQVDLDFIGAKDNGSGGQLEL